MKKYLTSAWYRDEIKEVECKRETEKSVWVEESWANKINIRRHPKDSGSDIYHNTWEEAWEHINKKAEMKVKGIAKNLKEAQETLIRIQNMKS